MTDVPTAFGRTVYGEIDAQANADPLGQAADWVGRLEPWFGACRSVAVVQRQVGLCAVAVVSAGHADDRAAIVHLASHRPTGVVDRVRIEGSRATLEIRDGMLRLSDGDGELDAGGMVLPAADPARAAILRKALTRALESGEVETNDG